jgi:hypothetical protein
MDVAATQLDVDDVMWFRGGRVVSGPGEEGAAVGETVLRCSWIW